MKKLFLSLVGLPLAALSLSGVANAQAVIQHTSGLVVLGVRNTGSLNEGNQPSYGAATLVGVRYVKPALGGSQLEYTSDATPAEGWGVAFNGTTSAVSNLSQLSTAIPISFASTANTATAVAATPPGNNGSQLQVTHQYFPSVSDNLFQVDVTLTNIGVGPAFNVLYRRNMDWDIQPTPFNETVEIGGWPATNLIASSNYPFEENNPLLPLVGSIQNQNFTFANSGYADQGASFTFNFGNLAPGGSTTFHIFYGGADSRTDALNALAQVQAEVYSLSQPNLSPSDPAFSTGIFAFSGVGGTLVVVPESGTLPLMLAGLLGMVSLASSLSSVRTRYRRLAVRE